MILNIISIIILAIIVKAVYNYFDKNDKWEHGDQFGNLF